MGRQNKSEWDDFIGCQVVIDTNSPYIYLGTLAAVDEFFITLKEVDVHDQKEGATTKEIYILDAKKSGIKINRHQAIVRKDIIVSFSKLEDVVEY